MFKKILSMLLTVTLIAAIIPAAALADEETQYISEIKMGSKGELEGAQYKVFDEDLNSGTSKAAVYIGYKTTPDPAKAITDIKVLGEGKDYQMIDAESISREFFEADAMADAEVLIDVVEEFRQHYNDGEKSARLAYAMLQNYSYNADMRLGDYLVGWMDEADLSMVALTADDDMKYGLYCALYMALRGDDAPTWQERLADTATEELDLSDSYYKTRARKLLVAIKSFRVMMSEALEKDEDEAMDATLEAAKIALEAYEYNGTSMFDFFMDAQKMSEDFIPLANVLTDNEITMMQLIGFANFSYLQNEETKEEMISEILDDANSRDTLTDFWQDSVKQQSGKIAVTSDAIREMTTSGSDEMKSALTDSTKAMIGIGGVAVLGIVMFVAGRRMSVAAKQFAEFSAIVTEVTQMRVLGKNIPLAEALQYVKTAAIKGHTSFSVVTQNAAYELVYVNKTLTANAAKYARSVNVASVTTKSLSSTKLASAAKGMGIAGKATIVLMVIAFLVDLGFFIADLVNRDDVKHSEKPTRTLSLEEINGGDMGYVLYDAVLQLNGEVGDANANVGDKWNVLYTSTDTRMGTPIKADTFYVSTSEKQIAGRAAAAFFGQVVAADLNKNVIDHEKSIYLFFERANADTLASIFAQPQLTIFVCCALLLLLGVALIIYKRKKKIAA